jgi:translocation and assembly module TamA
VRPLGLVVVLLAGLAAACAGRQRTGGDRVGVRVEGARGIDVGALLAGLALSRAGGAGQPFDPYLVSVDEERVRGFYLRRGYFHVEVASVVDERPGAVEVVFHVREGPRSRLARVEIGGLPRSVAAREVRDLIALRDGNPFDYGPYDDAKARLLAPLERAGYAHARVAAAVFADVAREEAVIRVEYEPGPRCRYGTIVLRGVRGPLADAARARLRVREGDRYSTDTLDQTQALLYEMGRFASVRVSTGGAEGDPVVPVTIDVMESDRNELRLGGGLGVDPESLELHGRVAYAITGWPRPLLTTRIDLEPAAVLMRDDQDVRPQLEASATLERIDFPWTLARSEVGAAVAYLEVEPYTSVGPRFRIATRTPLGSRHVQASAGWQVRFLEFVDLDPAIDEETAARLGLDVERYQLGFFEQSLVIDHRDDPVATRRGVYAELRLEEGTRAAGGDFDYLRVTPELRGFHTPGRGVVLAARARAGTFFGDVPVTQRYYAGGASSQRGFAERRLSPVASQEVDGAVETVPVGGGSLAEMTVETRIPVGTIFGVRLGAVVFVDAGDVTETREELHLTDLHWATGAGVRVGTPIGPVRLDVGYRLNRTGPGEPEPGSRLAFHLSIGEAL